MVSASKAASTRFWRKGRPIAARPSGQARYQEKNQGVINKTAHIVRRETITKVLRVGLDQSWNAPTSRQRAIAANERSSQRRRVLRSWSRPFCVCAGWRCSHSITERINEFSAPRAEGGF